MLALGRPKLGLVAAGKVNICARLALFGKLPARSIDARCRLIAPHWLLLQAGRLIRLASSRVGQPKRAEPTGWLAGWLGWLAGWLAGAANKG